MSVKRGAKCGAPLHLVTICGVAFLGGPVSHPDRRSSLLLDLCESCNDQKHRNSQKSQNDQKSQHDLKSCNDHTSQRASDGAACSTVSSGRRRRSLHHLTHPTP
jgi:hypothetical protein